MRIEIFCFFHFHFRPLYLLKRFDSVASQYNENFTNKCSYCPHTIIRKIICFLCYFMFRVLYVFILFSTATSLLYCKKKKKEMSLGSTAILHTLQTKNNKEKKWGKAIYSHRILSVWSINNNRLFCWYISIENIYLYFELKLILMFTYNYNLQCYQKNTDSHSPTFNK